MLLLETIKTNRTIKYLDLKTNYIVEQRDLILHFSAAIVANKYIKILDATRNYIYNYFN